MLRRLTVFLVTGDAAPERMHAIRMAYARAWVKFGGDPDKAANAVIASLSADEARKVIT